MLTKEEMITEIMLCCRANNVPNDGDVFLALAFRTEPELIKICQELHIKTDK